MSSVDDHDFEPAHGLPEPLPPGERMLWQGAPDFAALLQRAFHFRTLTVYFALILAMRAATVWAQGGGFVDAGVAALWLLPAALLALANVALLAWLTSRTAVYTITDRRVVMRVGIVLTVTFNLPFSRIDSAAVQHGRDGVGDIALSLAGADRIAYLHLWPHARPWRLKRTEPSLRSIADVDAVGRILSAAWGRARGVAVDEVGAAAPARPYAPTPRPAALVGTVQRA